MHGASIRRFRLDRRACLIGLAYFVAAAGTIAFTRISGGVAGLWIATAILLAELTQRPPARWLAPLLACGIASFSATSLVGFGVLHAGPLVAINLSEAVIGACLLHRFSDGTGPLESLAALAKLVIAAGAIAPAISGLGGATIAMVAGGAFLPNLVNWFVGHALGTITFAPMAMLVLSGEFNDWRKGTTTAVKLEALAIGAAVLGSIALTFGQRHHPLLFLPNLPIILAAFRLGRIGAASSVMLLALVGGVATVLGVGPIAMLEEPGVARLQFFQLYLAVSLTMALPVAAELRKRKRILSRLAESEARYRLVTENATDIVMNLDRDGIILYASPSVRHLSGFEADQVLGRNALDFIDETDQDAASGAHAASLADPESIQVIEYRVRRADGSICWFEGRSRAVTDRAGTAIGTITTSRDISTRKRLEAQLSRDAETDYLTGLYNRRSFIAALDRIAGARLPRRPCSIALFDIDHFKRVNDQFGHAAGDAVLSDFAALARAMVREGDMVARFGGEEFAVLLRGTTLDQASIVCDRIRQAISQKIIAIDGRAIRITVSAGVAELPPGLAPGTALRQADDALYRAKHAGRNRLERAA